MSTNFFRSIPHEKTLELLEYGVPVIVLDHHDGAHLAIDEAGLLADVTIHRFGSIAIAQVLVDENQVSG